MKRWISVWIVLMLLLLAGCGKEETPQEIASPLCKAAELQDDEILLAVDGREQPAWRYLYWLAKDCVQLQVQYETAGLTLDWDAPLEDGGTLADYAKEQALADTVLYATVEQWAERYHCVPDETDSASAGAKDRFLTPEQTAELTEIGRVYGKLYALYCTPGSDLAPVEGELSLFAVEHGGVRADRILIADRGDREAARKQAEEIFAQLNNAADQEEMFLTLAAAGDDPSGPRVLGSDSFPEPLLTAAKALQPGQYSGILESPEGFSILRRLPENGEDLKEAYFDDLLQSAAEKSRIQTTEAYARLSVRDFYAALTAAKKR